MKRDIQWKIFRMGVTVPDYRQIRGYCLLVCCADLLERETSDVRDYPRVSLSNLKVRRLVCLLFVTVNSDVKSKV